jgi:tetratricopeptide (TPR) repeat protein
MTNSPVHWKPLVQQASALFQAGRLEDARQALTPLLANPPPDIDALMLLGMVMRGTQQIAQAVTYFSSAHDLAPDNPQILNVYANALAAVGEVQTAIDKFSESILARPDVLESHINLALVAVQDGQHQRALDTVEFGLENFPGNARLLAIQAMALRNADRISEALPVFRLALTADPNRALTHRNYAATLMAAGDPDAAALEFSEAARLGLNDRETYLGWAAARLERGEVDAALAMYNDVVAALPFDDEAARAIARISIEYRADSDAFEHYRATAETYPTNMHAWLRWVAAALSHNRFSEAYDVASKALFHFPDANPLIVARLYANGMMGDPATVIDDLLSTLQRKDGDHYRDFLCQIAIKAGDGRLAAQQAEIMTTRTPLDQSGWAYLATAWRILGDEREHWLCDYERLIGEQFVNPVSTFSTTDGFTAKVAETLNLLHKTLAAPGDQSLRGGTQTSGSLFDRQDATIQALKQSVTAAVQSYINTLPKDSQHPFLQRISNRFRYSGSWSVKLKAQGHHVPHFHGQGWISSAFYARLPDSLGSDERHTDGWIGFGQLPSIYGKNHTPRKLVKPQEGLLVLFPSYMWHGTMPFVGDQYRLTAAFDIIPA